MSMAEQSLWTIDELLAATGGKLIGDVIQTLTGVEIDSRAVSNGDIFIAIKGDNQDGHSYVSKALKAGAGIAVVSQFDDEMSRAGPLLVVGDTLEAMEKIGLASRARSNAKIIAVTGSVGKTTTKDALGVALDTSGKTHISLASFNNHWGVPLTLARMPRDTKYGVFEVGMNHAGEISTLVAMVRPHIAIITAIAESHLGHFTSVEAIADAKAEIFEGIEAGGAAIINRDSQFFDRLKQQANDLGILNVIGFGHDDRAEIHLKKSALHNTCSCVTADVLGDVVTFKLGSPGEHVVMNTLAVLGAVKMVGADLALAALSLSKLQPPKGRGVRIQLQTIDGPFLVIDESYNANPVSMRAALALLARAEPKGRGRRVAVMGDMLELGENGPAMHKGLGEAIEDAQVDSVYACGPMMKTMFDALPSYRRAAWFETSRELENQLLDEVRSGDVMMVKGSLGSKMGPLVVALQNKFKSVDVASA